MAQQVGSIEDCNWSYPGSNTNVPSIMVFRPTWDEFKDFNKYVKYMESCGANKAGVAKIIPPQEWNPRKSGYNLEDLMHLKIRDPICQVINGNRGIFQSINVRKRCLTLREFHKKAGSTQYRPPPFVDYEDLERKYWKNVTFVPPIYGADVPGSITDKDCDQWNIQRLGSCLDWVNEDYNVKIDGVNTAYLYFGMWKTTFAWHTEDMDLHSINYLHYGESKFWYSIPTEYARRFERMATGLFPNLVKDCPAYLRHKMCLISPNILRQNSIPYNKIVQKEGEFMITFPLGYHSGFNTGFNIAESTNFATERWVEYGKRCLRCYCKPDTVHISMDCFVKRIQPERYDDWLKGADYGRHPEEPNAKPTPAAPPTVEEFILNPKNKDKAIPLCLLEPQNGKKRRHPIHKKKGKDDSDTEEIVEVYHADKKTKKTKTDIVSGKKDLVLSLKRINPLDHQLDYKVTEPKVVKEEEEEEEDKSKIGGPRVVIPKLNLTLAQPMFGSHVWPNTPLPRQDLITASPANYCNFVKPKANDTTLPDCVKERWVASFVGNSAKPKLQQPQPPKLASSSLTETISKLQSSLLHRQHKEQQLQHQPSYYVRDPSADLLNQRQANYPEELKKVLQSTGIMPTASQQLWQQQQQQQEPQQTTARHQPWAVLVDPRFAPNNSTQAQSQSTPSENHPCASEKTMEQSRRKSFNQNVLTVNEERPICSSIIVLEGASSDWHPPLLLPSEHNLGHWTVNASVNVCEGVMYLRLTGPYRVNRSFMLPFKNILATSKRHQNSQAIWPPCEEMMDQCDDLRKWVLNACIDPYQHIKATIIDPWNKAYILTIPVKLLQRNE